MIFKQSAADLMTAEAMKEAQRAQRRAEHYKKLFKAAQRSKRVYRKLWTNIRNALGNGRW